MLVLGGRLLTTKRGNVELWLGWIRCTQKMLFKKETTWRVYVKSRALTWLSWKQSLRWTWLSLSCFGMFHFNKEGLFIFLSSEGIYFKEVTNGTQNGYLIWRRKGCQVTWYTCFWCAHREMNTVDPAQMFSFSTEKKEKRRKKSALEKRACSWGSHLCPEGAVSTTSLYVLSVLRTFVLFCFQTVLWS